MRKEVGGRMATVSYLTAAFEPATPESYELLKVVWDDGRVAFLVKADEAPPAG
jgi:hypothetical protein